MFRSCIFHPTFSPAFPALAFSAPPVFIGPTRLKGKGGISGATVFVTRMLTGDLCAVVDGFG